MRGNTTLRDTHTRALTGAQTLFTTHLCSSLAFPRSLLCPLHSFQTASRWLVDVAAHQMTATSPKASLPFYAKWAVLASPVAEHTHTNTHMCREKSAHCPIWLAWSSVGTSPSEGLQNRICYRADKCGPSLKFESCPGNGIFASFLHIAKLQGWMIVRPSMSLLHRHVVDF